MMTLEEQLREKEMWRIKNLMSSQGAGNAIDSLQAPMAPTANIPMAEEATTRTALQQQAITKARNAEYAGMSGVQGVDVNNNALGAGAKVLTAWALAKKGKKVNEAAAEKLGVSADKDNAILAKALARKNRLEDESLQRELSGITDTDYIERDVDGVSTRGRLVTRGDNTQEFIPGDSNRSSTNARWRTVNTNKGVFKIDPATGEAYPLGGEGEEPLLTVAGDVGLQENLAGAREVGKERAGREFTMEGVGPDFEAAEALLADEDNPPTASGFGSILDSVGNFFGHTFEGAEEAAALKTLGGHLTSKMPRMEGPQSDADREQYREMAAMVGDDTIPVPQRRAALKTAQTILNKYINPAEDSGNSIGDSAPPADIDAALWNSYTPEQQKIIRASYK